MGAIFGFTGCPDDEIKNAMSKILEHRGVNNNAISETNSSTICYLYKYLNDKLPGAGLYKNGNVSIALAGYLINPEYQSENALKLLSENYLKDGISAINVLRGAFVIAVQDDNKLYLARDGAGMRSIYYGKYKGRTFFSIEPKGITVVPGFPREIRPGAVAQYLTFSFIPESNTMLKDVFRLPAGHTVLFDRCAEPKIKRFHEFEKNKSVPEYSEEEWIRLFKKEHERAVSERLLKNEDVGVFLSGGLDSSVIAAEVAKQHNRRVKTYSIHFGREYPNELQFARMVATRAKTDHEELEVKPKDFIPRLRKIVWYLDEPIGDPITVPNFELAARASKDIRLLFNGEGGDHLFGGPKNVSMMLHHWYGGIDRSQNFRERMYLASYRRAYDELPHIFSEDFIKEVDFERDLENVLTPFFKLSTPDSFLHKLSNINIRLKGENLILPKVERMTSAWGLTSLSPLYDEKIMQLSFQIPPSLKLKNGVEKIIVKEAYRGIIDDEIIARPKSGMRVPVYYWFKDEMQKYAKKILDPKIIKRSGIFNHERIKQILDYDLEKTFGRYGLKLWMLITFELWRRIVVDGEPV